MYSYFAPLYTNLRKTLGFDTLNILTFGFCANLLSCMYDEDWGTPNRETFHILFGSNLLLLHFGQDVHILHWTPIAA